jgi:hypothetical protein
MDVSGKAYEELVELTGFGLAPVKHQGRAVSYDSESQATINRWTHVVYGLGYIVTREEQDDGQYMIVSKRRSRALAFSMRQTKENVAANPYNRAFDSNYAGGDGAALISTAHPTRSGNQSNHLPIAADISEAAIEDLIIQIMGATNSRGLKINLMPQSLHVHRSDWFEANRIYKSVLQNDTDFSDPDAWFIRTNTPSSTGMVGMIRRPVEFTRDNDFDTENAKAKSTERYVFGWGDFRGVYGSPGA